MNRKDATKDESDALIRIFWFKNFAGYIQGKLFFCSRDERDDLK